jgi:hypothetical protein
VTLYAEGLAPATDVAITLTYMPPTGDPVADAVHLTVIDPASLASLQTRHRYFDLPGDLGGLASRSYAANGSYHQYRLGLGPVGEYIPLKNRTLLAKALFPLIGAIKTKAAYYRGLSDGFWIGLKGDWESLKKIGQTVDAAGNVINTTGTALGSAISFMFVEDEEGRLARLYILGKQLRKINDSFERAAAGRSPLQVMKDFTATLCRDLYTDAEAALGWEPLTPNIDPQVLSYMSGIAVGYVGEQVTVGLATGAAAAKITAKIVPMLQGLVTAFENGTRYSLEVLDDTARYSAKMARLAQKIPNSEAGSLYVGNVVEGLKNIKLPSTKSVSEVFMLKFKDKPALNDDVLRIFKTYIAEAELPTKLKPVVYNYTKVLDLLPNAADISEDALKGWARFCGSIGTTTSGSKYTNDLIKVFGGIENFDKAGFEAVMKQLSEAGNNGFKLTLEAGNPSRWNLPDTELILDTLPTNRQGHSLSHIFAHTVPNFKPGQHSVFSFDRGDLLPNLKEAWLNKTIVDPDDAFGWEIDMGRVIGSEGQTKIRIIVNPTTKQIITAYPVSDVNSYL